MVLNSMILFFSLAVIYQDMNQLQDFHGEEPCETFASDTGLHVGINQIAIDKLDAETLAAHHIMSHSIVRLYTQP